tara:strand:+ start:367 stop:597 length:231 start_codon:yes stop_codon:yes gene_type:complete
MQKQEFIDLILQELGEKTKAVSTTKLRSLEVWDSMSSLVLISLVDEYFEVILSSEEINKFTTFQDVLNAVGEDKFN